MQANIWDSAMLPRCIWPLADLGVRLLFVTSVLVQEVTEEEMSVQAQNVCQSGMHLDLECLKNKRLTISLYISHAVTKARA